MYIQNIARNLLVLEAEIVLLLYITWAVSQDLISCVVDFNNINIEIKAEIRLYSTELSFLAISWLKMGRKNA